MGTDVLFRWLKRLERDPNQSPGTTNEWSDTSTPLICPHGVGKENFIFVIGLEMLRTCDLLFVKKQNESEGNIFQVGMRVISY
jgi:hypothetical protein